MLSEDALNLLVCESIERLKITDVREGLKHNFAVGLELGGRILERPEPSLHDGGEHESAVGSGLGGCGPERPGVCLDGLEQHPAVGPELGGRVLERTAILPDGR